MNTVAVALPVFADDAVMLANNNIIAAMREHAAWQSSCELVEQEGMVMMAGATGFPGAFHNCAARIDPQLPAAACIALAQAFFGKRQRSFTMLAMECADADLEAALLAQGFAQRFDTPCMLVTSAVKPVALAAQHRIVPFSGEQQVRDAIDVIAEAYRALGLSPEITRSYFADPAILVARGIRGWIAYEGDTPLSTALTIKSEKTVGIYWVGTVPAAQRMGLAGACTAAVTNDALTQGASLVTLQASAFGEPVYRRLGYHTYDRLRAYRHPGVIG